MNCVNHPSEPAVAACADCGKGLCAQCAADSSRPLCPSCRSARRRSAAVSSALHLAVYALLFCAGYRLDFMSTANSPDRHLLSGYIAMAVVSGWQFINAIIGWRLTQASPAVWFAYGVAKLLVSAAAGLVTAPATVIWNIVKFIRNIS